MKNEHQHSPVKIVSPRHEEARAKLRALGCHCVNRSNGPGADDPTLSNQSALEWWTVPARGVIVCQFWLDGNGVTMYADWPLGHTWDELERAIKPAKVGPDVVAALENCEAELATLCDLFSRASSLGVPALFDALAKRVEFIGEARRTAREAITKAKQ